MSTTLTQCTAPLRQRFSLDALLLFHRGLGSGEEEDATPEEREEALLFYHPGTHACVVL